MSPICGALVYSLRQGEPDMEHNAKVGVSVNLKLYVCFFRYDSLIF